MSVIDRAFIRAYETDDEAPPAAPAARRPAPQNLLAPAPAAPHIGSLAARTGDRERRPLSAFATAAPAVEARFRPALEVDNLRWSAVSEELIRRHNQAWRQVLDALLAADDAGRGLIGVVATARGAGATTITGCLARLLADAGKTVAVVDGDFAAAGLGPSLGLAAEAGWEDVLAGRLPLAEAVIHSLGDRLAVLPLLRGGLAAAEKLDAIHASVTAGVLRYHYDVVLFDLGAVDGETAALTARRVARRCRLDGALLVGPAQALAAGAAPLAQAAPEIAAICLGVLENPARAA